MRKDEIPESSIITTYFRSHPRDLWLSLTMCLLAVLIYSIPRYLIKDIHVDITALVNTAEPRPKSEARIEDRGILRASHNKSQSVLNTTKDITKKDEFSAGKRAMSQVVEVPIDPNRASFETLMALGMPERVASNWSKYIQAGGKIDQREDLERIYGMTSELLMTLEGKVKYPSKKTPAEPHADRSQGIQVHVDINRASPEEWQAIYGIGPVLSNRIVKFRDALGGFHTVDQVGETYGVSDSLFRAISKNLYMEGVHDSLYINRLTEAQISAHPYVTYKQARILHLYKKEHGPYAGMEDLWSTGVIDSGWQQKMAPYISFSR